MTMPHKWLHCHVALVRMKWLKGFTISETAWRQNEVMTGNLKK
jgi:hypothetical protein